jgi:RHS repeat-associated protein
MSRKFGNLALLLAVVLGLGGRALASSTATITVNGAEQSGDAGAITVSFSGFVETVQYGQYSTPASIASAFGAKFSNDYLRAGLCAYGSGSTISFKLKGTAPFGTLDVTGSTASFQLSGSGFATQVSKTVDTGTVTLTVNGTVAASTNYGDGATPSTVAAGLAASVTSGSPVNVTAVDSAIFLQSKQTGATTDYSYTLQTTSWDSTDFPSPSFVPGGVGGSLDGGANAGSGGSQTIYSYSIPSYVSGSQPTGYDADGNIVGYTDSLMGTWSMSGGYDPLNRLTYASATAGIYSGLQMSWGYDAFGNRTSESLTGTTQLSLPSSSSTAYNASNRISSTSLGSVGYDAAGDVTQDNQNQYLYNGDGRVCAVKNLMLGTMTGYVYGADGTRVSTGTITTWGSCDPSVNGYQEVKATILGPSGGQLTETGLDASGNVAWSHTNVWASGKLIATYDPNGLHFYLSDWNGSRRVQTDYEGVVEKTCTNLPYGNGTTCDPSPAEELYAGLESDSASGLDNAMYRSYATAFGQWTTPDSYEGSYDWTHPQSLNRYAYVGNSPFNRTDPNGQSWLSSWIGSLSNPVTDLMDVATILTGGWVGALEVVGEGILSQSVKDPYDRAMLQIGFMGLNSLVAEGMSGDWEGQSTQTPDTVALSCSENILNAVNNQFGSDDTSANVTGQFNYSKGAPDGQGTLNLNISSTQPGSPGRYPINWWSYIIGYGPTLHVPNGPGGSDSPDTLKFNPDSPNLFTAHIDSAYPYGVGFLFHYLIDMKGIGGYQPCP